MPDAVEAATVQPPPTPFFLPAGRRGRRFAIHHAPARRAARSAIVYLHPLAEEMNKSRRMAALAARALAADGHAVLQVDLYGCGDSEGDFAEAGWDDWVDDALAAMRWLQQSAPAAPVFWGLRAGCLVAAQAACAAPAPSALALWQPPLDGRTVLQQFLRVGAAARFGAGTVKEYLAEARQSLAGGREVEIAGYRLGRRLADGIEASRLAPCAGIRRVHWFELSMRPEAALPPASTAAIAAWTDAGVAVDAQLIAGPAFWQSAEIVDVPALVAATVHGLGDGDPA